MRRRSAGLGGIPLTVLSSSRDDPWCADPAAIAERRRFYSAWYPLQEDLARLSSNAVHVVAEQTGHHVHRYRPDVVVGVVLDHVRRARSGCGTR
ncbi:hypothetical protein AB0L05_24745 [Nonomuraea pusilla]|uniref:hypothetical protein n=1 Tax=Nonomuraea pusilla TaxID=46177 RepID=UPI003318E894